MEGDRLMQPLETRRLRLIPFSLELKRATLKERARLPELLKVSVPDSWPGPDMTQALPFFIEMMQREPAGSTWDGIIIHKADQVAIGCMGFHGKPNEAGVVEIGYNIIPAYQGHGYATEMARQLIRWAFQTPDIKMITAQSLKENAASIRVLEKIGMRRLLSSGPMLRWNLKKGQKTSLLPS